MLVIRFLRIGKKNQPAFKIVVVDKRKASKCGRFTEEVGFFNPLTKEKGLKKERIQYWLSKGVKPSDTVYNLLIEEKIIEGKKIPLHNKKEETGEAKSKEAAPAASAPAPAPAVAPAPAPTAAPAPAPVVTEAKPVEKPEEKPAEPKAEPKKPEEPKKAVKEPKKPEEPEKKENK